MTNSFQECSNCSKYGGLDFNRLRSGPFEGPAIVIPPALPEDTYCRRIGRKYPWKHWFNAVFPSEAFSSGRKNSNLFTITPFQLKQLRFHTALQAPTDNRNRDWEFDPAGWRCKPLERRRIRTGSARDGYRSVCRRHV